VSVFHALQSRNQGPEDKERAKRPQIFAAVSESGQGRWNQPASRNRQPVCG